MRAREGEPMVTYDCVEGSLLLHRIRQPELIPKGEVRRWMREIAGQLSLYHRSGGRPGYRYLNPYSVVVSRQGEALLLDLEAASNGFVFRNMQKRCIRSHFALPCGYQSPSERRRFDLACLGETLRFLLDCAKAEPMFGPLELQRLKRCIRRCKGETGREEGRLFALARRAGLERPYVSAEELLAELPGSGGKNSWLKKRP